MYIFLTLDSLVSYLSNYGIAIDLSSMTSYQISLLFIVGNAYYLFVWIVIISFVYKLLCRILRFL